MLKALRKSFGLTQAELAGLVAERVGAAYSISADHIGKMERGVITWPDPVYRKALREIFSVESDSLLGFFNQRTAEAPADRLVPIALHGTDQAALVERATWGQLGPDRILAFGQPSPLARVQIEDVADMDAVVNDLEHRDHQRGGGSPVRAAIMGQLTWGQETLRTASFTGPEVRRQWMITLSRAARLAGFSSFDAGDHEAAFRCFLLAQELAGQAGDWSQRVNVLCGMTRQALYLGRHTDAARYMSLSRAGEDEVTPATRAMLGSVRARTNAALHRPSEAMRAVEDAERALEQRNADRDPAWLWYYDDAQLAGDTGHALFTLAIEYQAFVDECDQRLSLAVSLHNDTDSRGKTFSLAKLALLRLRWAPGPAAIALAMSVVSLVAGLRSARADDDLRSIRAEIHKNAEITGAEDLSHKIDQALLVA